MVAKQRKLMKLIQLTLPLLIACACAPAYAQTTSSPVPLFGTDLAGFSMLAGGYATYGAGATVSGNVGAMTYVVGGADSKSGGDYTGTPAVSAALEQLASAQSALKNMGAGTVLAPTMAGSVTLAPGVYSASALTTAAGSTLTLDGGGALNPVWVFNIDTYLVTGALTTIQLSNAGDAASVLWNTGGYTSLGASTSLIGSILSGAYISQGAGASVACGNAFAASYISVPAGANVQSSNCAASGSWDGSVKGMGSGVEIVDGVASAMVMSAVPEPETYAMLLAGLGLLGFIMRRRKHG